MNPYTFSKGIPKTEVAIKLQMIIIRWNNLDEAFLSRRDGETKILFYVGVELINNIVLVSVQFTSVTQSCPTPYDRMDCSTPGFPVHHQLPQLAQIHVHRVTDAIQQSYPLLSPSPPAFSLPTTRVFSSELVLHIRWPKYWSFSFSISPSNEYSGLISFKTDWFDLLAVQGTLKRFLQHQSSKASVLQHSACFIVQLSYPSITTEKTIALTS